jgi:hypothetical protein
MANILGLAAIAGNAAQDQVIARRKDQVLQEEEADARSKREEFAARRGLRDNAAAFEGERVTQGRKDFGKSAADKQAVQDAIKKAAADFASQNPYRSAAEPVADNSATSEVTASPAPQSAVGIAPEMLAPTPGTVAAPVTMAAGGITAAAPAAVVRAQTVSTPSAKPTDPSHGMERAAYIAQAAADQHLANGDMASYKQASDDAIHMRDALRAERFNKADALYAQTGDATVYTKLIYPLFNDGYSLVEAKQVSGADGKPVLSMTRRNNQTGDVETKTSTVDQFLNGIKEIRRPGTLAALEERIAAEKRDVANQIEKGAPELASKEKIAAATVGVARDRLNMEKDQFKKKTLDGQLEEIESVVGSLSPEDRKKYGLQLAGLGKDDQADLKFVNEIITKGVESGTTKPEDAPNMQQHMLQGIKVSKQENIIAKELGSAKEKSPGVYAELYSKATKISPPDRLRSMGFNPPPVAYESMSGFDPAKQTPEHIAFLQSQDPEAYANGVASFNKTSVSPTKSGKKTASNLAAKGLPTASKADALGATYQERVAALEKKSKDAAEDPELLTLQSQAEKSIKAGNRVAANNALAKLKELKQQRYGL